MQRTVLRYFLTGNCVASCFPRKLSSKENPLKVCKTVRNEEPTVRA